MIFLPPERKKAQQSIIPLQSQTYPAPVMTLGAELY